jgi:aminoglycoside phosphotransferase family enzyme
MQHNEQIKGCGILGQGHMAADAKMMSNTEVTLEQKLKFLLRPESYPDRPGHVDTIETHMSWVFLTDRYAYKLKKPVQYDFLDLRSIEARRQDAEDEISLNTRLAPEIYLERLPLTRDARGTLGIDGEGEAVDWLVKMRRLPIEQMLDHTIRQGTTEAAAVKRAAVMLAEFYRTALPIKMLDNEYIEKFKINVTANLKELSDPKYQLPKELISKISTAQFAFLQNESALLAQRVRAGKIIEAHGDLRPEHIWLGPQPVVIDCLEFKREYRILDTADELAFLAMECEHLAAPWVGQMFFEAYREVTGDQPAEKLLHFYKSYRATLRAKITIWHLKDAEVREPSKWIRLAKEYLHLAEVHAEGL